MDNPLGRPADTGDAPEAQESPALYKIGRVSKLFGISCETIRNYERAGLIRSVSLPDSPVRYYDIDNVRKLVGIRLMRNQGFSVSELAQVYRDVSIDRYSELARSKIEEDELALRRIEIRLAESRRALRDIESVRTGCMPVELMHYQGGFYVPYNGNDMLHTSVGEERLQQWTQNLFHVRHMAIYPELSLASGRTERFLNAFHLPLQYVEPLEIDVVPPVKTMTPMRCVSCIVRRESIRRPFGGREEEIAAFLRENGLELAGWGFSLTLFGYHEQGKKNTYFRLYLPIRETGLPAL